MSAIIIDFATHRVKHLKYSNTYIDEIDEFDDFDTWDEQLVFNKVAFATTCFEATHWIPSCSIKGILTARRRYRLHYSGDEDSFYIVDDCGDSFYSLDIVEGEYTKN